MRKRWEISLSRLLTVVLITQCLFTGNAFAAEVAPDPAAPVMTDVQQEPAVSLPESTTPSADAANDVPDLHNPAPQNETPSGNTSTDPVSSEPQLTPAPDASNGSTPSENAPLPEAVSSDAVSGNTASENTTVSSPSVNSVSEQKAGEEETPEKKKATVMLYMVGSDLERNSLAARSDLLEIMKGIETGTTGPSIAPSVNFIAETGGMKLENDNARNEYNTLMNEKANSLVGQDKTNFLALSTNGLDFTKNQRWEISSNTIKKAANDEAIDEQRGNIMTAADGDGLNGELLDFIDTTVEKYPADQYILIFWDHGGGPKGGFGNDERGAGNILSDHIAYTIPQTQEFGENGKKLAWVGYDACLMGNLETALAWAPFAWYFSGSEELEGGDGWDYTNWVAKLYSEAKANKDFTDETYVRGLIASNDRGAKGIVQTNIDDFVNHYSSNATQSLVDLSKINEAGTALSAYADSILTLLEEYPLDAYYTLRSLRKQTKGFGGSDPSIMDLNDFIDKTEAGLASTLTQRGVTYNVNDIKTKGQTLKTKLKAAVISENHTSDISADLGGLTAFFPYISPNVETGDKDEWQIYRSSYDGSALSQERYQGVFTSLNTYRDLISLYLSIRKSGEHLNDGDATQSSTETAFSSALSDYKVPGLRDKGKVSTLPATVFSHRIQNEALKVLSDNGTYSFLRRDTHIFDSFCQELAISENVAGSEKLYLGYLPAGGITDDTDYNQYKQRLYNHTGNKWFELIISGNAYPAPIYSVYILDDSNNALTGKVDVMIPVANVQDKAIYFLDVSFDNGSSSGRLNGYWPFSYEYDQLERYFPVNNTNDLKDIGPLQLVGNIAESKENRSGIDFNTDNIDAYCYGAEITEAALNTLSFERNTTDFISDPPAGSNTEMMSLLKDIFDSAYIYGNSYTEEVQVSLGLDENISSIRKGSVLKEDDLKIYLKNPKGENVRYVSAASVADETPFILIREGGLDPAPISVNSSTQDLWADVDGTGPQKLVLTKDTVIGLKESAVSLNSYASIDHANVDLDFSYNLTFAPNGDRYTVNVYDTEEDKLTITRLSAPLQYLAYEKDSITKTNFSNFFRVYLGKIDVTNDKDLKLKYGYKSDKNYVYQENSLNRNLKPGAQISLQATFAGLTANCESDPLTLQKSPAAIRGTGLVRSDRLKEIKASYDGDIEVSYFDASGSKIANPPSKYKYTKLSSITKDSSASINTAGIDNTIPGSYKNISLSAKRGWLPEFTDYFDVREFVLSEYRIDAVSNVRFLSSVNRSALHAAVSVRSDKPASEGRIAVSDQSLPIAGTAPIEWYYKVGGNNPVIIYQNNAPVKYKTANLVEKDKDGKWAFYLPDSINGEDVIFYAGYAAEAVNQGDIEAKIDPITPVEYTGRSIVTTRSNKSGSKVIGLVVRSSDGKYVLEENTDYTVSYKNNKNVSDSYDSKPPTMIIKGKGDYKGLKYTINFTILPADLANASITADRKYAPLTSNAKKGVTLNTTVTLPGGSSVPKSRYEVHYYSIDEKGLRTEVTTSELASYYKSDKIYKIYVSATAKQPADQATNFVTGSRIDPRNEVMVYAYPKQTNNLSVSLKTSKYDHRTDGIKISDIFNSSNIKTLKVGKNTVSLDALEPVAAYYDKNLTKPVGSDVLKDATSYYLSVSLKDDQKLYYKFFAAQALKVTITGTKITKSNVNLMETKLKAVSGNDREPVSLPLELRFASDFKFTTLTVTCTQRDGGTKEYVITSNDRNLIKRGGMTYYYLTGVDNGAIGSYKVTVYGKDGYSGSVTYTYKVVSKL